MTSTSVPESRYRIVDDGGIVHGVEQTARGRFAAIATVYAVINIDGVSYRLDTKVRCSLKPITKGKESANGDQTRRMEGV